MGSVIVTWVSEAEKYIRFRMFEKEGVTQTPR